MRDAAGHDAVHHQPVTEAGIRRAQHALAQEPQCASRGEGGVVADGADVAEMIGEALKLGHQGAKIDGARGDFDRSAASTACAKAKA